jgi:SAM-dependent methyltransferase
MRLNATTLDAWNDRYRLGEAIDRQPAQLLVDIASALPPGRALDLACGAGRNAFWLAVHEWNVTAIDGASEAIRMVREGDTRIDARVLDLEDGAPLPFEEATFDLVAILYYMHRPLLAEAKRVLCSGGVLVTAVRTRGIHPRFCLSLEALRETFGGWQVLHARDGELAELAARKP